ncbi:malonyl CoA-acyl carrier protein transacylase, partial [Rathayibacter agropyri]
TVLVNESMGAGSTGDFAIRGDLFSADVSARAHKEQEAAAGRLTVANTLDFAHVETSVTDYQQVRAALFGDYSSREAPTATQEESEASPVLYGAAAAVVVPLVLVAGVLLGRFWARRKRAAV